LTNFTASFSVSNIRSVIVTAVLMVSAAIMGRLLIEWNLGGRELAILVLVMFMAAIIAVPTDRSLRWGYTLWLLTFGFGWRTVHVNSTVDLHPSEVLVWLLFLSAMARGVARRNMPDLAIPRAILLLMGFALLGIFPALARSTSPDSIVEELKVFLTLLPTYFVVKWFVASRADWERTVRVVILVAVYVSCLGLMDYFTPGLSHSLVGTDKIDTLYVTDSGLGRVGFIFYGNFSAGFLIFTFFGLTAHSLMSSFSTLPHRRIFGVLFLAAEIFAMYLSGYRGLWYATVIFLVAYIFVQRRALIFLAGLIAALPALPSVFINRFLSLIDPRYADSSQFNRLDRAAHAVDIMLRSPLSGEGWGASGYVHSDLIQLGANLGIPALVVFIVWILNLIRQLASLTRGRTWISDYASALFATLCGLLVVFLGEGLIVWTQLMVPVWFLLCMAYRLIEFARQQSPASLALDSAS
jgi:hypothetical protein